MTLTPAQEQIVADHHRFRVLVCGRKFGKTSLFTEEIIGAAVLRRGQRVMYMAPTLLDARSLLWDRLLNRLKAAIVNKNDTLLEMKVRTIDGGTSDIYLGSWEKVNNYRGLEYDFILFDEVQEYRNFWVGWQEAIRPTLTPRKGCALFAGTPKGFNHLYDLFNLQYTEPEYASFRFTTYDNPHIDRAEIEAAKRSEPEDKFAQEYLADFRKSEGLVFKEFSRETHLYEGDVTGITETLAGVDFGYTNPTAVPTVKVKGQAYYVTDLLYRTGMTDEETADYVATRRFNKVYPDPENAGAIEVMRRKGVNLRDVKKGKDSIAHGINTMRELFKQNRLFIHKSCVNLIEELETYSYADASPHRAPSENPVDKNNHAIDALRYVVNTHVIGKPFNPNHPWNDRMVTVWRGR